MARGKTRTESEIDKIVRTLVPILKRGTSLKVACAYCKIPYTTVIDYKNKYETVRIELDVAENWLNVVAEQTLSASIEKGDSNDAKWWLERAQKEKYSTKTVTENTNHNLNTEVTLDDDEREAISSITDE